MPEELKKIFLKAFQQLPYKILWKYEDESFKGLPDNVMIKKWMPQQDILGTILNDNEIYSAKIINLIVICIFSNIVFSSIFTDENRIGVHDKKKNSSLFSFYSTFKCQAFYHSLWRAEYSRGNVPRYSHGWFASTL